jgi:hypothetical protein
MNNKYSWEATGNKKMPYVVTFRQNSMTSTGVQLNSGVIIAITDSAEKAQFIATACNKFETEQIQSHEKN